MTTVRAQAKRASFGGSGRKEGKWRMRAMRPSALMVGGFSLVTLQLFQEIMTQPHFFFPYCPKIDTSSILLHSANILQHI
jgi:hypothetical protein